MQAYGQLPLSFEANQGQTDANVKFFSRGRGYTLFLTAGEIALSLNGGATVKETHQVDALATTEELHAARSLVHMPRFIGLPEWAGSVSRDHSRAARLMHRPVGLEQTGKPPVVRIRLAGVNPDPRIVGLDELPGKSHYFIGNDPGRWRTNIPNYAKVKYEDVYPGVDLVFYGNQRELEYDFVIAPGARADVIGLDFRGADRLEVDPQGDLVLHAVGEQIRLKKPFAYQEVEGIRKKVAAGYVLEDEHRVSFQVATYDASRPLIIDPVLVYSTYAGGGGNDVGRGIAVDASGNAYITGDTSSANFPTVNPLQATNAGFADAFVTKLNPSGSALIYSTYLGGGGFDFATSIAVDASGNAYVTGYTYSTDFPTLNPLQATSGGSPDAFVAKLSPSGAALVYSTYLGGSSFDLGASVVVDASGSAHIAGNTSSTNFPVANALQPNLGGQSDAFVAKLNPSGSSLVYSTYLGGSSTDSGWDTALDASGNAYFVGGTSSRNFPTLNPFQTTNGGFTDVFIAKIANDPAVVAPTPIPTLSEWGLLSLIIALLGSGIYRLRKRTGPRFSAGAGPGR